ncbi:MAG: DNA-binding transcriptional regulator OxyR [Formosa sp.]|nr:DNA-binding transcriptional regulator OxyR [Formosa sp.]|tara:strand:+ start:1269 stop:2204 length:936 start_codon:yes stop_codon:yes gene_type:complete
MTITQLYYILAVAEYSNFTKAAKHCLVTQPTLSMQIQKLEDELKIQIFDRTKKPIELTNVGVKIVTQAKTILAEVERVNDIVDQEKGFIGGEFKLGISNSIMPTLLPLFFKSFISRYPKVKLNIEELKTNDIINKIKEGNLDGGIVSTPLNLEDIKERVIFYEKLVGYISENHRLKDKTLIEISDLDINDILFKENDDSLRNMVVNMTQNEDTTQNNIFNLKSDSIEMLVKLTNEEMGMTVLPYLNTLDLKTHEIKNLRFFKNPHPAREVSLIYNISELKIQIINSIHKTISENIKDLIKYQKDIKIISPI